MAKREVNDTFMYRFTRPIINVFVKMVFHPKYIGLENIPKKGRIILAGTHTSKLDAILMVSTIKRSIHFLAKEELWHGKAKFYFANMGMIPVNRKIKDHNALKLAEEYLENENLICIFPEGTTEREKEILMPFKIGAVKMARDTNTKIIPFAISGDYGLFKKIKIKFGKPFEVKEEDLDVANKKLEELVSSLRKETK